MKKKAGLYKKGGYYYAQWFDKDGKRHQKSTGSKNKAEAQKIANEMVSGVSVEPTDSSVDYLVKEWVKEFQADRSPRTVEDIETHCGCFSDWLFDRNGHRDASKVTKRDLIAYRNSSERKSDPKKPLSSSTLGIKLRTIRSLFNWAFKNDIIPNKPFATFKMPKSIAKDKIIERGEMQLILETVRKASENAKKDDEKNKKRLHYLYILLIALTGMRKGEFESCKMQDIGNDFMWVTGKSGARRIYLTSGIIETINEIKAIHGNEEYLFCNEKSRWIGRPGNHRISKIFRAILLQCGLDKRGFTLHTIRHSMISYHLADGVNIYTIRDLAGHKSVTTTEWYAHLSATNLPDLEWWNKIIITGMPPNPLNNSNIIFKP